MNMPEKGFYYHYKHDPKKDFNNYAYEVLGVARHSEDKTLSVVYKPVYNNTYLEGVDFSNRPLDMFMETVEINGIPTKRFTQITDPKLIAKLKEVRDTMY